MLSDPVSLICSPPQSNRNALTFDDTGGGLIALSTLVLEECWFAGSENDTCCLLWWIPQFTARTGKSWEMHRLQETTWIFRGQEVLYTTDDLNWDTLYLLLKPTTPQRRLELKLLTCVFR